MNNFENVDLEYYGEDVYLTQNKEYHEMQGKIKKYLLFLVDTMLEGEYDKKSIEAKDFILDLLKAAEHLSYLKKQFDGDVNRIIITDRYIIFDYNIKQNDKLVVNTVIIDKKNNDFNFISNKGDIFCDIVSYNFSKEGIKREVFEQVETISMINDDSIDESITEIKSDTQGKKIAV